MKRGFGPLQFRTKFFLSSFFVTVILPLFGVWLLYNQDIESTKELIYSNLKNQINNLSLSIYPAIAFDDNQTAFDQIKGFSSDPILLGVKVWKKNPSKGNTFELFVSFPNEDSSSALLTKPVPNDFIGEESIKIYRLIKSGKEELGVVLVTRSLRDLKNKQAGYLQVGDTFNLVNFCHHYSDHALVPSFSYETDEGTYESCINYLPRSKITPLEPKKTSRDEFGRLTDIFNDMLDSIQESNLLLRSANEEMEQRVERRTKGINSYQTKELQRKWRLRRLPTRLLSKHRFNYLKVKNLQMLVKYRRV